MSANDSRLALAAWMAERGELHAALLLVKDVEDAGEALAAARARARFLTEAERHGEAVEAWRRVLGSAPDDREARLQLARAKRLAKSPILAWVQGPPRLEIMLCAAAFVTVIAVILAWRHGPTDMERVEAALARLEAGQADLRNQISSSESTLRGLVEGGFKKIAERAPTDGGIEPASRHSPLGAGGDVKQP